MQCSFTVDNVVNYVKYNGQTLSVTGTLNNWTKENRISFRSCNPEAPGTLEIRGTDSNSNNNCFWGGLLLRCTADMTSSPWNNFMSNAANWKDERNQRPCQNDLLFPRVGRNIGFIKSLNSAGAKKIWAARRTVTLFGTPGDTPTGRCANVQCSFTVDNVVNYVKYNGQTLSVTGTLNNWTKENRISFRSCNPEAPGTLEIRGTDSNSNNNCFWGGLLLRCTADMTSSPWNNFMSNAANWKDERNQRPCQNDLLFPRVGRNIGFIKSLNSAGAKKIWAARKTVTLIGTPSARRG